MRIIDADELKKKIENIKLSLTNKKNILNIIDNTPTVTPDKIQAIMSDYLVYRCEPQRPQGKWLSNYTSQFTNPGKQCSLCGKIVEFQENYCPKCGADMRGEEE